MLNFAAQYEQLDAVPRCPALAGDSIKVIDLVKKIINEYKFQNYNQIGLFLPTCPFRNAMHIKEGIKLLSKEDFSVVSVCEMQDPIQLSLTIDSNNSVINPNAVLNPSPLVSGETRSQDFTSYHRVNGGFYIAWMNKISRKANFFQGKVKGYVMDKFHSVDIDHACDLDYANMLIEKNYINLQK